MRTRSVGLSGNKWPAQEATEYSWDDAALTCKSPNTSVKPTAIIGWQSFHHRSILNDALRLLYCSDTGANTLLHALTLTLQVVSGCMERTSTIVNRLIGALFPVPLLPLFHKNRRVQGCLELKPTVHVFTSTLALVAIIASLPAESSVLPRSDSLPFLKSEPAGQPILQAEPPCEFFLAESYHQALNGRTGEVRMVHSCANHGRRDISGG